MHSLCLMRNSINVPQFLTKLRSNKHVVISYSLVHICIPSALLFPAILPSLLQRKVSLYHLGLLGSVLVWSSMIASTFAPSIVILTALFGIHGKQLFADFPESAQRKALNNHLVILIRPLSLSGNIRTKKPKFSY